MAITLDGDLLLKPEDRKAFYEKLVRDIDEALGKEKDWDPDLHPREPAGSPEGGQFTSGGGDTGADAPSVTYALVADASEAYDRMAGGDGAQIPPSLLQDSLDHFITQPSVNLQRLQVEGERNVFSRHLRDYERGQMPQIPEDAEGFKRYEDFIASKGLKAEYEEVDPRELVATQAELDSVKVAAITKYLNDHNGKLKDTGGVLVTSREHAINDGHHRWAALASYATLHPDEGIKVRVLKVDTDIDTLLAVTHEFDRIEGIASESFSAGMTGAGSKEVKPHGLTDAHDYDKDWEYAQEEEEYRKEVLSRKKNPILKAVVGLLTALGIKTKEWDEDLHPRGEGGLFVEAGGETSRPTLVLDTSRGFGRTVRSPFDTPEPHTVARFEKLYQRAPEEHAIIVRPDGSSEIVDSGSRKEAVSFTDKQLESMKGAELSHNHPINGAPLSWADAAIAIKYDLAEIRAVSKDGWVSSLKAPAGGWDKAVGGKDAAYKTAIQPKVVFGSMRAEGQKALNEVLNENLREIAEKHGATYTYEKVKR